MPKGYKSIADYYNNYLFGRSPEEVERRDNEAARERAANREQVSREMHAHRERYGD
jgi:hypothetical protein